VIGKSSNSSRALRAEVEKLSQESKRLYQEAEFLMQIADGLKKAVVLKKRRK